MQCSEEVRGGCNLSLYRPPRCLGVVQPSPLRLPQDSARGSGKSGSSMKLKIIPKVKKEREKLHKQKSNSSLSGKNRTVGFISLLLLKHVFRFVGIYLFIFLSPSLQEPGTSEGASVRPIARATEVLA